MTGEGQLFLGGEDAHANAFAVLDFRFSAFDKGGLGEIGFARDRLHRLLGQRAWIQNHRKWVSGQPRLAEDIEHIVFQTASGLPDYALRHLTPPGNVSSLPVSAMRKAKDDSANAARLSFDANASLHPDMSLLL